MSALPGDRKFYDFSNEEVEKSKSDICSDEPSNLINYVADNIIGNKTIFTSPYGTRKGVIFFM